MPNKFKEQNINHTQAERGTKERPENLYAHTQAGEFFTNTALYQKKTSFIICETTTKEKATFSQAWKKARDNQERRVATRDKVPYKRKWTIKKEKETAQQLIEKNGEHGTQLGYHYKKYWDYEIDLDFYKKGRPEAVSNHIKQTFIKVAKMLRVKYWETSNGNAKINLLSETELDRSIYYINITDKWGNKHHIGEILGKNRQTRETHREARGEGKWKWGVKNLEVVKKLFKLFFVEINDKRLNKEKYKQISNKKTPRNIKVYQPLNISQNIRQIILKDIKLGEYKKLKRLKGNKPLFKQFYNGKKYFLIDTKYSGNFDETILDRMPEGSIRSVILAQGVKHQFFKQLWTEP